MFVTYYEYTPITIICKSKLSTIKISPLRVILRLYESKSTKTVGWINQTNDSLSLGKPYQNILNNLETIPPRLIANNISNMVIPIVFLQPNSRQKTAIVAIQGI